MYLIQAKVDATAPDFPGQDVEWKAGQVKFVHESLIEYFKANPVAWTVLTNLDHVPVMGEFNKVTGGIRVPVAQIGPIVALAGDSILDVGDSVSGNEINSTANSVQAWAKVLSGQRFVSRLTDNYAVAGQTSAYVLNTEVPLIVAALPDVCVVLVGTNDISGGVSVATITANLSEIYTRLINAGIAVIAIPILPRSYWAAGGNIPVSQRRQIAAVNQFIRRFASTRRGMFVADATPNMIDFSNGLSIGGGVVGSPPARTAYTSDGLHPSPRGAYWAGKAVSDVINQLYPANNALPWSLDDVYDAATNPLGNVMLNGMFSAASGGTLGAGATGTVAGSWTARRTLGTTGAIACSVVQKSAANGQVYNAQRIACTAPSGSAVESFQFYQMAFTDGFIGQSVICEVAVEVSGIGSANALKGIRLSCSDGTMKSYDLREDATYLMPDVSWSGVMRTQPIVLSANVQMLDLVVTIDGTVAGAGVTVDISRAAFRIA